MKNLSFFWVIQVVYKVVGDIVRVGNTVLDLDLKDWAWSLTFPATSWTAMSKPIHISRLKSLSPWNAVNSHLKESQVMHWQRWICHEAKDAQALNPLIARALSKALCLTLSDGFITLNLGLLLRFLQGSKFCISGQWAQGRAFSLYNPILFYSSLFWISRTMLCHLYVYCFST